MNRMKLFLAVMLVSACLFAFAVPTAAATAAGGGFGSLLGVEGLIWGLLTVVIGIGIALLVAEILALFIPGIRKLFGGLIG